MAGLTAALVSVLIFASYPVATRAGLAGTMASVDLIFLRFGIGALLFLPFLVARRHDFAAPVWRNGLSLAILQGAGMGGLVICGLQYAPASHAAALGPGAAPVWVALLGLLLYARTPSTRQLVGGAFTLAGVAGLVLSGGAAWNPSMLAGDLMFLAASALGAAYVLRLRASGMSPFLGAALVAVYSAAAVWPWYLLTSHRTLASLLVPDLWWHLLWQGFLIGFIAMVAMNQAIARLGSELSSALFSLVPVMAAILGTVFLAETPTVREILAIAAISTGVLVATTPLRRPAAARAQA